MNIVRNIRIFALTLSLLFSVGALYAQRASSLRLSEVMSWNENSIIDQKGRHIPWIEIYNSSSATVDIKGCYLTNDKNNLKKSRIPIWSTSTKIGPKQYMILWLDASDNLDHLNFDLDLEQENYLALVDADGKTIIDEITIPVLDIDESYIAQNLIEAVESNEAVLWTKTLMASPKEPNIHLESLSKVENVKKMDPNGSIMTITAILVVFFSLMLLSIVFYFIGKLMTKSENKNDVKNNLVGIVNNPKMTKEQEVAVLMALTQHLSDNGEVMAAISMAIRQASEQVHDTESLKLTIKHRPSSWNDRAHGMRKYN